MVCRERKTGAETNGVRGPSVRQTRPTRLCSEADGRGVVRPRRRADARQGLHESGLPSGQRVAARGLDGRRACRRACQRSRERPARAGWGVTGEGAAADLSRCQ